MTREEIILKLRSVLNRKRDVKVCLLFGSAAKGKSGINSDVDIAVGGTHAFTPEFLAELQMEISEKLESEVDLLGMARLNGIILRQVLTTGKKIINRNPDLLAQYIDSLRRYVSRIEEKTPVLTNTFFLPR